MTMQSYLARVNHISATPCEVCDICAQQDAAGVLASKTVPITPMLLDYIVNGTLEIMRTEHVRPFFGEVLEWRVVHVGEVQFRSWWLIQRRVGKELAEPIRGTCRTSMPSLCPVEAVLLQLHWEFVDGTLGLPCCLLFTKTWGVIELQISLHSPSPSCKTFHHFKLLRRLCVHGHPDLLTAARRSHLSSVFEVTASVILSASMIAFSCSFAGL